MRDTTQPLTIREYADWAQVTAWTVRQWILKGQIRAVKIGREWRIDPREVQTFAPTTKEAL